MNLDTTPAIRVLHVTEILQGGVATYMNELLSWQGAHFGANRVALVCPLEHLSNLGWQARDTVQIYTYSRSGRNPISLARLVQRYRNVVHTWHPTLLHVHSTFAGGICRLPWLKPHIPMVYCAHGWAFVREDAAWMPWLYAWVERVLQYRADTIVAITHHEKQLAVKAGLDGAHIYAVRCGLRDLPDFKERKVHSSGEPLQLLFIGRFDRQKGLDWLLHFIQRMDSHQLQLSVVGADVLSRSSLPSITAPHVHFYGWASPEQVEAQLDACDAVIMPSRWEGFGLVAIEAMRKGVPVIASNRGALPEVLGHGEAGWLFDLDRPEALRKLLLGLTQADLVERGRCGRIRFAEKFTGDRMNKETISLYKHVVDNAAQEPAT